MDNLNESSYIDKTINEYFYYLDYDIDINNMSLIEMIDLLNDSSFFER